MSRLTFVLTGEIYSPPMGSYEVEPNKILEVPNGLRTFLFGIIDEKYGFYLAKINLYDGKE